MSSPREARSKPGLTLEDMRRGIAELAGQPAEAVGDDDDLIAVGLDSIDVMKLASIWTSRGAKLRYGDLLERRTLREWWELAAPLVAPPVQAPRVAETDDGSPFDLATMQHAYWFGRGHGQPLAAPSHFYFEFDGDEISPQRLEAAVRSLIKRHPMLRARFTEDGRQQILPETPWRELKVRDLRHLNAAETAEALEQVCKQESSRRLEVELGLGLDVQLSLVDQGKTRLHINIDMLVSDAASFRILVSELAELYVHGADSLPSIDYSFRRYLAEKSEEPAREEDQRYWEERAATLPGPPQLPLATEPARLEEIRSIRREYRIDGMEWARLAERAKGQGVTLPMLFLTVFSEVLAAWSTSRRFLLHVPLFDRRPLHPDIDRVVGDFTGSILLEADLSESLSFVERARRLQERFRADAAHAGYSGVSVLRDLWRSNPGHRGQAAVVFTSALGLGELFSDLVRSSFGRLTWMISQTPQVLLDHQIVENEGELLVNWDAVDGAFAPGVLDSMFEAYCGLLRWLTADGTDWAGPLPDLLPATQRAVREAVNDTGAVRSERRLHQGFFEQAARAPERTAVLWGDSGRWSYGEVAEHALRLAARLRNRGVTPGEPVAVSLPKGPAQVIAVLGVLSAGGVYVPVSRDQPEPRRRRILERAGARITVDEELLAAAMDSAPLSQPVEVSPETLAYILFTSGSTGEPKGVEVTHRAAMSTVEAINRRWELDENDRCLAVSALEFDLSVYDLFGLLTVGGGVVVLAEDERRDAERWVEQVRSFGVTVWNTVPALLDLLLSAATDRDLHTLRLVLLGGDWVGAELPARLAARSPQCRFVALGGTTETAIHSTACEVVPPVPASWHTIPYGTPLSNVRCRIVDERGRDCPDWVAGELWIGGAGVADGYRGDPETTASRFVRFENERWFRTGDQGRYWPDGTLEFLGRTDHQVKIRGHRVELGEIESALEERSEVENAVVVAHGDGNKQLGAAVQGTAADAEALRRHLRNTLPDYMVPSRIVRLDAMPLSTNGKVDRVRIAELLASDPEGSPGGSEAPQGEVEQRLAELWSELLDVREISRQDSFFALGGDSLLATAMVTRLRQAGLEGASLGRLTAHPSLEAFAATLKPGAAAGVYRLSTDPEGRHDPFPMTHLQRAYWLGRLDELALGGVGSYWYWEFDGKEVDLERIEECWNRLVIRHDMLRVVFDDEGRQKILAEVPRYRIQVIEASPGTEDSVFRSVRAAAGSRPPLDLDRWPLYEIQAVQYADGRCRLGFGFDYIALDALSIMTLFGELETLYLDPAAELPSIGVSFRDYVRTMDQPLPGDDDAREFWLGRLETLPSAPQLPLQPAKRSRSTRFTRREIRLRPAAWRRLEERARHHGLTPSTILAAAYGEVLSTWSGGRDVTLNFTLFDRQDLHPEIRRVAGDFTSLLLVPYRPRKGETFSAAAQRLQNEAWEGLEHRSASAIWVMRELASRRGAAAAAMPVVFTSTLGVADRLARLSFPFGTYVGGVSQTPQVLLDNQVVATEGELLVNWDAVEDAFAPGVLDAMFGAYRGLLEWLSAEECDWERPLPPCLPAEQALVREELNEIAPGGPPARLLHEGFFSHAARSPNRTAILGDGREPWSYGEVARHALQVAALLRNRNLEKGQAVVVSLPKGRRQVVAVLGVLSAGGAYVPVSSSEPETRRRQILEGAGARIVIDESFLDEAAEVEPLPEPIEANPRDLAYVIYTSGSTGTPKGVEISHQAAMSTIDTISERWHVHSEDRCLAVSALEFDLSVYDIFGLLSVGGAVVVLTEDERRNAELWAERVQSFGVTVWSSVPALLDLLLESADSDELGSLRLAMASGDWVGLDLKARLAERSPACRLVALGGATEAAIWSNALEVTEVPPHWTSIPYGTPLRNASFRAVDERGQDCPDWVAGELWIGGQGLANGYRGNPDETAKRFVEVAGQRWYRTGDLGRYWPDGTIELLGRADFQVKIRGYRVELGEVETALGSHPEVRMAVAVAYGETHQRLGAAIVGPVRDPAPVVEYLSRRLPSAMLPGQVVILEEMPLTTNGKIDRRRVSEIVASAEGTSQAAAEPPREGTEARLAELFSELLGPIEISRHDTFVALGGDSLMAMRLARLARQRFGLELPLRNLFASFTLAELATVAEPDEDEIETGTIP